jgi:hypothetical protein
MKFLRLIPAFGDLIGIWKLDIFRFPDGDIISAGHIQMKPFLSTNADGLASAFKWVAPC